MASPLKNHYLSLSDLVSTAEETACMLYIQSLTTLEETPETSMVQRLQTSRFNLAAYYVSFCVVLTIGRSS